MTSPSPERNGKAALRAQLLARRDLLSEEERRRGAAIIAARAEETLASLASTFSGSGSGSGAVIAVYAAKGSEVDALAIDTRARQLGLQVAYPRVVREQRWLELHLAEPEALVPAGFGLREPPADTPTIALADIRCFFVPGIAFDEAGGRLGWGRGYYDNTFARAPRALRIGLAFECQVVDRVPQAEHDILLHGLFTEAQARRFGA